MAWKHTLIIAMVLYDYDLIWSHVSDWSLFKGVQKPNEKNNTLNANSIVGHNP